MLSFIYLFIRNIWYKEPKSCLYCELLRTVANTLRNNVYTKKEHSIN